MSYLCADCGIDTTPCTGKRGCRHMGRWEHYMVRDHIWKAAGMLASDPEHVEDESGFLCIGCLELRLGRKLRRRDFTDCALSYADDPWHTARLRDRLTRR